MKNSWKVEIRTTCRVCGGKLPNARYRTFCSKKCRTSFYNKKAQDSGYSKEYQRKRRDGVASVADPDNKCQCLICGKWYVQVGTHAVLTHKFKTAREYREYFKLEVNRGITPKWYRKMKGEQALDNGTYKNLQNGAKFRYKQGDKRAGKYERSPVTLERLRNNHKKEKFNHILSTTKTCTDSNHLL